MQASPGPSSGDIVENEPPNAAWEVGQGFQPKFDPEKHTANTRRGIAIFLIVLTGVFYTADFIAVLVDWKTIDEGLKLAALIAPIQASATTVLGFYYVLPGKDK
jgi:hypothetical protein